MAEHTSSENKEDVAEIASFDATKKKKKKKVMIQENGDDDHVSEKIDNPSRESLLIDDGVENAFAGIEKKKKITMEADLMNDGNSHSGQVH
ncbi:hypothetical protein Tco_1439058 [Tanacetum coccineum]